MQKTTDMNIFYSSILILPVIVAQIIAFIVGAALSLFS